MEILKLYAFLQSCRNDNTSTYIIEDESGIYKNNNYIFGVPLISTQDEAIKVTSLICDEFEKIKNKSKYNYDYRFMTVNGINSLLEFGLHLVIVSNDKNEFLISETTAVIECTIDGDYLFTYVPVSPKIGLILAKSKYFYTRETIEYTKNRLGMKHCGFPDTYLSEILEDEKLIFNVVIKDGEVTFDIVRLDVSEIIKLNTVIYEDGQKIFSNEDALNSAKINNLSRKIIIT